MDRDEVFTRLRERGVAQAAVEFSGGRDEGETDKISLLDANDVEIGILEPIEIPLNLISGTDTYARERQLTAEEEEHNAFIEVLEAPVWDRYVGLGGDYRVEGAIIWAVADETVTLKADEFIAEYVEEEV
jgi:hypothetical protein